MRKFRLYAHALLLSACVFLCLHCENTFLPVDSSKKIDYLQGNTKAAVTLKVLDKHSSTPVSGVMVTISGFDSAKTDSKGTVVFDSVQTGSYLIICSKAGFESIQKNLTLSVDQHSNTVPVVNQSTEVIAMAKKGVTVRGNLYFNNDSKISVADGAKVECRFTDPLISFTNPIVSVTSSNGTYSFNNLPEYCEYTITVLPFSDGTFTYKHEGTVTVSGKAAGDTLRANHIFLQKFTDGNFFVMNHNLKTFTRKDTLKIQFSEAVDTDLLEFDSIYVSIDNVRILTRQIWRQNNKELLITPFDGVWDIDEVYVLVIKKIKSVSGKPLDNSQFTSYVFAPVVSGPLGNVEGLDIKTQIGFKDTNKVDYNTSSLTLKWSRLANASSYQIYQKTSSDSLWHLFSEVTDTFRNISSLDNKFNLGKEVKFIVLGENSSKVSSFEDATILTIKDQIKPRFTNDLIQEDEFDNSLNPSIDTAYINVYSSYFPEPMDTTSGKPKVIIEEDTSNTIDPNKCFWNWTSNRAGVMKVVLKPNVDASNAYLRIDFSSVTDLAGNKTDTANGGSYLRVITYP